nr:ATP-binding protein [Myxococcus vastator]
MGLFIVKHIVDAHGGVVRVHSTEQEGTTFQARLPRQPAQLARPGVERSVTP